jgi:hypothetical protein
LRTLGHHGVPCHRYKLVTRPGACCYFPLEFNHVAVGVSHVGERLAISVLASPDQTPSSPLNLLDRPVEVLLVGEPEAEVPDSTAIAGPVDAALRRSVTVSAAPGVRRKTIASPSRKSSSIPKTP